MADLYDFGKVKKKKRKEKKRNRKKERMLPKQKTWVCCDGKRGFFFFLLNLFFSCFIQNATISPDNEVGGTGRNTKAPRQPEGKLS